MGAKHLLGAVESCSGGSRSSLQGRVKASHSVILSSFVVSELLVHPLGSLGEVSFEATKVLVLEVTGVLKSSLSLLLKVESLLSSSSLVLVHDLLEHTASALVVGKVCVGLLEKCVDLILHPLVHSGLDSLLFDDGTGHGHDVALDLGLDLLEPGSGINDACNHHFLGVLNVLGGGCLSCLDVCHSLGETDVLESGVLSNVFVELSGSRFEVVGNLLCVVCHLLVDLDEALVSLLGGLCNAILHSLDDLVVASHRCSRGGGQLGVSCVLGGLEGRNQCGFVRLHLLGDRFGVVLHDLVLVSELLVELAIAAVLVLLSHSLAVLVILTAHDTNLLAHFLPVGQEGLVLLSHSIIESIDSGLLVSIDCCLHLGTSFFAPLHVSCELCFQVREPALSPCDGVLQVLSCDLAGRLDGEDDLLLHLGASLGGLEGQGGDLAVDVVLEVSDLGGDLLVHRCTSLRVDSLHLLLDLQCALLTLVDGICDSSLECSLVECGNLLELGAALGILDCVGFDDARELQDLAVVLLLVGLDPLVKGSEPAAEVFASLLQCSCSIKPSAAGGLSELLVDSFLCLLVGCESAEKLAGGSSHLTLVVCTVLLRLALDLVDLSIELQGHVVHGLLSGCLVLGHQSVKLLVLLDVLVVTTVTDLDDALELSINLGVHLSLLELVA